MLKFNSEKKREEKVLTFGDVEDDQLFLDYSGCLCQKITNSRVSQITDSSGQLFGYTRTFEDGAPIRKIFTDIKSITEVLDD